MAAVMLGDGPFKLLSFDKDFIEPFSTVEARVDEFGETLLTESLLYFLFELLWTWLINSLNLKIKVIQLVNSRF